MRGMVQVTLVRGSEETLEDAATNVVESRLVDFTKTEFPIRRNARGYLLPSRWAYMLHEYGACSGTFPLPAAGCTTILEAPIDWGTVEALHAPSQRCEASAVSPHERQVARVIPQWPRGRASLMMLRNQLFQQEPGPPGPPPPSSYSSSSESVESGEWWDDDDEDDGGATGGAVDGDAVYTEGD